MMKRLVLWLLLVVAVAEFGYAYTYQVRPRRQRVCMFGVATSFTDSLSYITDLQTLDAYILPNGFLADRTLYSLQFNNYLVGKLHREGLTCTVFFSKNKSKLEKKYQKVRRRFREHRAGVLQPLGIDLFHFETEEWVDATVTESTPTESVGTSKKKK